MCELIARRQALGIAKYGTTVADNPLDLRQWLVHQQEELADALVYCTRAIEELDAANAAVSKHQYALAAINLEAKQGNAC